MPPSTPRISLGTSGLDISRLVYGVWRLAESADTSVPATLRKIHACLDQGITTFDHADIYGNYACEALFGDALKAEPALAARLQTVTKCGIMLASSKYPERRVKHYDTSAAHIRASVDASLQKLGVEVIDLLLLHRPDPFMDAAETGACLNQLVQSGKVRAVGVSNFQPWDCELLQSAMQTPLATNQIELSLLAQQPFTDGQLAYLQRKQLPPMAWSPLAGGALFGDGAAAQRVRPVLQALASQYGVGLDAVAVAWLLAHPARIVPVLGTNDLGRVQALGDAFKVHIDRETWYQLYTLAAGVEVP
ncbi:putative oxidoreductase [Rhodoferax ferrireducens]|uniref:Oxidoreductase n=1 Tax=Rhodoferax ferrireducens TaxID=192843 RepID=A0ABU2CDW5_9BURK|nr:aldo/keto reductase [Rhodoferax ferrireducens]MDR7379481.1 putative oxidoreductase [Rhodoferax ferrireducens]